MKSSDHHESPKGYIGIEVGSVSVKRVHIKLSGEISTRIIRHGGNPKGALKKLIDELSFFKNCRVLMTGQASQALLTLTYRSETECLEKALAHYELQPDILLSLGGETFCVYPIRQGRICNIISSSKCAAGTGEFMVQQFQRMGMSLQEGLSASLQGEIVQLAARCSVHCKSDATHKLNKGECRRRDIARSLVHDLSRKVREMVEMAQWPEQRIVLCGGVAMNEPFVENLRQLFPESDIRVLPTSACLEAFGAALYASEAEDGALLPPAEELFKPTIAAWQYIPPLKEAEHRLDYRVQKKKGSKVFSGDNYILGLDAGSTTTKAILMNEISGHVVASCYLRTLGNPLQAAKECLQGLIQQAGEKDLSIIQAAVTGSGREMVSVFMNSCLSFNEILAHARAASEEVPDVDTVFEIGGQDSKFIAFLKGVPVDYAMNEGCSAGTGSFLEESASVDMGIPVEDISTLAVESSQPVAFGERCAAFINTDLRNSLQQGARQEDVIAGLVYSIADNYASRVVGSRQLGNTILFQGGVALNRSVALAIAARTGRNVVVPPHPELMGCIGAALMARDLLQAGDIGRKDYQLKRIIQNVYEMKSAFRCESCENQCEIQMISVSQKRYPFGGLCAKYEIQRHGRNDLKEGRDLVALRYQIMFESSGPTQPRQPSGTIGLPMALTTHHLFPFYAELIEQMGYQVVLSSGARTGKTRTGAAICYPCQIVHDAVHDLLIKKVDYILLPNVIELEIPPGLLHSYVCPSTAVISDILKAAFVEDKEKILSPHLGLSGHLMDTTLGEIEVLGRHLGKNKQEARQAGLEAFNHYKRYKEEYRKQGEKALEEIAGEPAIVIAGRPYTAYTREVNLALPRKITSRGYHVIPADMLPPLTDIMHNRDVWHFTQEIGNAVKHVKQNPDYHLCLLSCFSCGPDSVMYHAFREELAGQTFCYLEIDAHTAHAGFETRIGAFLDIVDAAVAQPRPLEPGKVKKGRVPQ